MENKLEIFKNEQFGEVRTVIIDGEPWFVLKDLCNCLEINNSRMVSERLDEDEKGVSTIDTPGGNQEMSIVSESGLYKVIFQSRKENALKFQSWVTKEVIPKIRKHGIYATDNFVDMALNNPENMIKILKAYEFEKKAKKEIKLKLEEKTVQLDENKKWFSIKRIAALNNKNWRSFNWKNLKNTSDFLEFEIKKTFDANYGNVNAYHIDVWKHEYPGLTFEITYKQKIIKEGENNAEKSN
jgi:prophage antirepressor-like protein